MAIRGTCDSCGKGYRLPAAGRDYTCKACGGRVHSVEHPEPEPEAPEEDDPPARPRHGSVLEHREAVDARRRASAWKTRLIWGSLIVVLAAGVVGFQLLKP